MSPKSFCTYFLAVVILTLGAHVCKAASLPLGTLTLNNSGNSVACPKGFFSAMTCYSATVSDCVDYLDHTLPAYDLVYGITPQPIGVKGVIVLHDGSGGQHPYNVPNGRNYFASDYYAAGFQVVQVEWTTGKWQATGISQEYDVKGAACRPATFFNYIRSTYYVPIYTGLGGPGFCMQGFSGGTGLIAYYLAEYGGASYVDKAELAVGPEYADLQEGCAVPNYGPVTGCPGGGETYPCAVGVSPWTYGIQYYNGEVSWCVGGGGDNGTHAACNNTHGINTGVNNSNWKNMSIIDGLGDSSFDYPNTDISGYECTNTDINSTGNVNPSSEQGWLFYSQFPQANIHALVVHTATCWSYQGSTMPDPEGIVYATIIDGSSIYSGPGTCHNTGYTTGYSALCNDMVNDCVARH